MGWEELFDLDLWTCDLKINRDHLLIEGNTCTKFGIDQVKGSKDIERTTHSTGKSVLTLTFEHVTWKSLRIIYSLRATSAPSLVLIMWRGQKILSKYTICSKEWFDLDLWTCDLKINRDHLLIEGNLCTKFCFDQVKGSKDIEWTTLGLQTDRPTDIHVPTDRQLQNNMPPFSRGA